MRINKSRRRGDWNLTIAIFASLLLFGIVLNASRRAPQAASVEPTRQFHPEQLQMRDTLAHYSQLP